MERRKRRRRGGVFEVGRPGEDGRGFKRQERFSGGFLGRGGLEFEG